MTQISFPKKEEEILAFWREKKIFEKTLSQNAPKGDFVFYDGPPFATGLPHYGHIIAGTIKDVIPRYKTMQGFRVARRWGWDCHGLPIENLIEQEKGLKEKKEIERDIAGFNQACRDSVLRYRDEWKKSVDRTGRWVDMENDYKTMDNRYIEVIWWIFKELYRDGLIYEGYKSMHLCPRCETTLSNFEVTLGYKEVKDLGVTVKFQISNSKSQINSKFQIPNDQKVYLLAWTTTGWTLPGNMALAVGEEIEYVVARNQKSKIKNQNENSKVKIDGIEFYIVAKDKVEIMFKGEEYEIVDTVKGKDLIGLAYEPLFDFSREQVKNDLNFKNAFKVYAGDFVSTEEGTGIVHIAPAFGEDDYQLSLKEKLPFLQHVNYDGTFKQYVSFAPGKKVKTKEDPLDADIEVIKYLAAQGSLFKKEKYAHSYPHCWRCDTPLINYAASSWFVKVTALKERLLAVNSKVNWVPEHIRDGRFGKWLEGARDWAISRSRYWGAPLPVWRCEQCKEVAVIGSVAELKNCQNKTPEKSEVLSNSAKDKSLAGTQKSWQLEGSIEDSFNLVNSIRNKKQPAEGLEPSQSELPNSSVRHAADMSSVYQKQENGTTDLHRPYIDEIIFPCDKCSGTMRRVEDVFDCWFESGAMPYASEIMFSDYKIMPQTTREELRKHIAFPADFIAEGTDQTRGWFYTLMVLGVALYYKEEEEYKGSPFKNVIVNGIVLAEDGQKMSKRLKNYPDPQVIMDKYGADAMRFYLMSSPAVRADSLNFSEKGVDEVYKKVVLLTLNVVQFWKMYADNAKFKIQNSKLQLKIQNLESILDRWLLTYFAGFARHVTAHLNEYEIDYACRPISSFINDLSTWYVRRSRERFKSDGGGKVHAVQTLGFVIKELSKLLAPITPFLAEYVYRESGGEKESVHLEEWPDVAEYGAWDMDAVYGVEGACNICEVGHSLRGEAGIKVRQILSQCYVVARNFFEFAGSKDVFEFKGFKFDNLDKNSLAFHQKTIQDELNIKKVVFADELPHGDGWISKNGVALYTVLDDSLKEEGTLRELTRQINNLRKKQGLTIADRVIVEYSSESLTLSQVIEKYQEQLKEAVLAHEVRKMANNGGDTVDIDGEKISIALLCQK